MNFDFRHAALPAAASAALLAAAGLPVWPALFALTGGLPKRLRRWGRAVLLALPLLIGSGKALANALFAASEAVQAYEYDYFVTMASPLWAASGLSLLIGLLPKWSWIGVALALAYFGIAPGFLWLALLAAALLLCFLPRLSGGRLAAAAAVTAVAVLIASLLPQSNVILRASERVRDATALQTVYYSPENVPLEQPTEQEEQPENAPSQEVSQEAGEFPWLLLTLITATLLILFVPAVIRDHAEKLRREFEKDFESEDRAAALRGIFLHSQRWNAHAPEPVPEEIYALWQEAAFSDHPATQAQVQIMRDYFDGVRRRVLDKVDRRRKFLILYKFGL